MYIYKLYTLIRGNRIIITMSNTHTKVTYIKYKCWPQTTLNMYQIQTSKQIFRQKGMQVTSGKDVHTHKLTDLFSFCY